jgi:excinuclease UvrABC nuclease subunit
VSISAAIAITSGQYLPKETPPILVLASSSGSSGPPWDETEKEERKNETKLRWSIMALEERREELEKDIEREEAESRRKLKKRLKALEVKCLAEIRDLEKKKEELIDTVSCYVNTEYPRHTERGLVEIINPPRPTVKASENGLGLPPESGVYFVWSDGRIVYIGESININKRARIRTHHCVEEGDYISFLLFKKQDRRRMENLYIGIFGPTRNRVCSPVDHSTPTI